MFTALKQLLSKGDFTIAESIDLPKNEARSLPIPKFLFDSRIGLHLHKSSFAKEGLWRHQAIALEHVANGRNVVVSTSTASGKSLIFRAACFHKMLLRSASRAVVFYPLKALAADQMRGWCSMAEDLGLDQSCIGKIDGSVNFEERDKILERSKILIMTPDVCHAWMMSRVSISAVKNFLKGLATIVIDEAHTLEGVFGSNFAFLLRRILAVRRQITEESESLAIQLIGATATIANPQEHLRALTGVEFESVTNEEDGSPHSPRTAMHIVAPEGEELRLARDIQTNLVSEATTGAFITFMDSRKGVELLARASQGKVREFLGNEKISPYRAGYDSQDRQRIEQLLQSGDLRGVVSTSALELGIDIPHLTVGINVGVPPSRKSYQQRLGRIGRSGEGAFLVVAGQNAFRSFGTSFEQYHNLSVEPSYLYLDNRFMQFAHARCLIDELEAIGAGSSLPTKLDWPQGFREVFQSAKPGGLRSTEFDAIAQMGGDTPQRSYPLRNVGEISFRISMGEDAISFGEVNEAQALRECYPGATYFHLGRAYEVLSWQTNAFVPYIKVRNSSPARMTKPRIRTWINAGITGGDLMERHLIRSPDGFLAECQMQITEKVEGYTDQAGTFHSYKALRQRNPNMRPRQRNFRTSGVILCIENDWFRANRAKQDIVDWIARIFCREYSILSQDVGSSATNIAVRTVDGGGLRGDCLVVYDQTYGSLRLTERLFLNFDVMIERLRTSAKSEQEPDRSNRVEIVDRIAKAFAGFEPEPSPIEAMETKVPPKCISAFRPGSIVCLRERGKIGTDVEIIQPTWMNDRLMYQVKCPPKYPTSPPTKHWVAADVVEQSADPSASEVGWWNGETEEYLNEVDE